MARGASSDSIPGGGTPIVTKALREPSIRYRDTSAPKRTFRATGIAFLAFVIALGAIGVVNGLWTSTLVVKGTVTTGDLNADWKQVSTNDPGATVDPCTPALNPSGCTLTPQDVGQCEYVSGVGSQIATVKVTSAYPDYECTITGKIGNTGSVPFNVIGARMVINNGNEMGIDQLGACTLNNTQVDPSAASSAWGAISCTAHVLSTAHINWTYYFAIEVCVAQWNEDPSPGNAAADFTACKTSPQHEGPGTPAPQPPGPTP